MYNSSHRLSLTAAFNQAFNQAQEVFLRRKSAETLAHSLAIFLEKGGQTHEFISHAMCQRLRADNFLSQEKIDVENTTTSLPNR